jgi:predicted dehydrogenase
MSIRFSAIGFEHGHIYGQVKVMLDAGAEFVSFYDTNEANVAKFTSVFPQGKRVNSIEEILEDESIDLIISADVPIKRAPLGIRAMQHGKDYMADKPGICTLEQLAEVRKVQAETGRIYSICFSERLTQKASIKAGELIQAGAIGQVVQTAGFGPHRVDQGVPRPDWFFDRKNFGGILTDIVSHQMDQFLFYTNSTSAEVVAATVGNFKNQQHPKIHDMGDATVRSPHASGYVRVDWLTPKGLPTWGDVRLFITGTDGYIELRKNVDIGGRTGENHLFLVDDDSVQYVDCEDTEITYGKQLIHDILNRTETAIPQAHVFLASELALQAEAMATDLTQLDN